MFWRLSPYNRQRAQALLATGNLDAAVNELERSMLRREDRGFNAGGQFPIYLAQSYAQQGRFADAVGVFDMLLSDSSAVLTGVFSRPLVQAAADVLRAAANRAEAPAQLPAFDSELHFVYTYTRIPDRIMEWPEKVLNRGDYGRLTGIWLTPSTVRKTDRFKAFVRKAGFVDYWRARGWPDLCHPITGDGFVCE